MAEIFISYRGGDEPAVKHIYDWLRAHRIPESDIYWTPVDTQNPYGEEFGPGIENAVKNAKVVLVVIGKTWTTVKRPGALTTRIKERQDWVRKEVELALRTQARVVPVLLDGTKNPKDRKLPRELHRLSGLNMLKIHTKDDNEFESDMRKLARTIDQKIPGAYPALFLPPSAYTGVVFDKTEPYQLFTGRDALLHEIHLRFTTGGSTTGRHILAITGLGGMGKTQTARKYAELYRSTYSNIFFLIADTTDRIVSEFRRIANLLDLPEKNNKDAQIMVSEVKNWFISNSEWLLILDNVDNLKVIDGYLPSPNLGHILLTTRDPATTRVADPLPIQPMTEEEGIAFFRRRIALSTNRDEDLGAIVREMGGLPLGLEQAGAYMEEPGADAVRYLALFQKERAVLLERGKPPEAEYDFTVATTWILFANKEREKVNPSALAETKSPASIELLRLCAFLAPDAIPEEIFTREDIDQDTPNRSELALGPVLSAISSDTITLNDTIAALLRSSLIQRDSDRRTFSLHRLVQAVIQDDISLDTQALWAERAVRSVNDAIPADVLKVSARNRCERYLAHAIRCANHIEHYRFTFDEAMRLLNQTGTYLRDQSRFSDAEPLLVHGMTLREQTLGEMHPQTVQSMNGLGRLYFDQYRYFEAEPWYRRALTISEQMRGPEAIEVAEIRNRLALTSWYMGNQRKQESATFYATAEQLYQLALPVSERIRGPEDTTLTLQILNNQALLYRSQGKYEDAIALNRHVLALRQKKLGPTHGDVAQSLQNLGVSYYEQIIAATPKSMVSRGLWRMRSAFSHRAANQLAEAETLLRESLAIRKANLSPKHVQVARTHRYLARVLAAQNRKDEAKDHYDQALQIWKEVLEDQSQIREVREEYALLLRRMKRYDEATAVEESIKALQAKVQMQSA